MIHIPQKGFSAYFFRLWCTAISTQYIFPTSFQICRASFFHLSKDGVYIFLIPQSPQKSNYPPYALFKGLTQKGLLRKPMNLWDVTFLGQ